MRRKAGVPFGSPPTLTAHETRVLQALWDGQSLSQAALNLETSYRTAESDRHKLKGKFGVSNVAQLIRAALRLGMLKV